VAHPGEHVFRSAWRCSHLWTPPETCDRFYVILAPLNVHGLLLLVLATIGGGAASLGLLMILRQRSAKRFSAAFLNPINVLPEGQPTLSDVVLEGELTLAAPSAAAMSGLATVYPRGSIRLEAVEDMLAVSHSAHDRSAWFVRLGDQLVALSGPVTVIAGTLDMQASDVLESMITEVLAPPPKTAHARGRFIAVRAGDRIRVRGALVLEPRPSAHAGDFRQSAHGFRIKAIPVGRDGQGAVLVAAVSPPRVSRLRRAAHAGAGSILAFAVCSTCLVQRTPFAPPNGENAPTLAATPPRVANPRPACLVAAENALAAADPWTAASVAERCDAPLVRAQANWMLGNFSEASRAFTDARKSGVQFPPSVSELEAHLLSGALKPAHDLLVDIRIYPTLRGPLNDVDALNCLTDYTKKPRGVARYVSPMGWENRRSDGLCRLLTNDWLAGADARIAKSDNVQYEPFPLPAIVETAAQGISSTRWAAQRRLAEALLLEQSLQSAQSPPTENDAIVTKFRTPVMNVPGEDPILFLRVRPLAVAAVSRQTLATRIAATKQPSREHTAFAEFETVLALDEAFAYAYGGEVLHAQTLLTSARNHLERQPNESNAATGVVSRSHLMLAAWTAYYAGDAPQAVRFSRCHNDTYGQALVRMAVEYVKGNFAEQVYSQDRFPAKDIFSLGRNGDGVALAKFLVDKNVSGRDAVFRTLPHLTTGQSDMRTWVEQKYPLGCITCGLVSLFENVADRRRVAQGLGLVELEQRLAVVVRRVLAAIFDRKTEVPRLALEISQME
jgi:hypothetical protein